VSVFWIHASTKARILASYAKIARKVNIIGFKEADSDGPLLVKEWFESEASGRWLIILDNADDHDVFYGPDRLVDIFPRSENGSIIMTTRDKHVGLDFAGASRLLLLQPLDSAHAQDLLVSKLGDEFADTDRECCKTLCDQLECIPLAIIQASAFMHRMSMAAETYLTLYQESSAAQIDFLSAEFEDTVRDRESKNPIATTWFISFEHIERRIPLAGELLKRMCLVDPQAIPVSLIQCQEPRHELVKALGTLQGFSLITARVSTTGKPKKMEKTYDLHRLVRLAMRNWLKQHDLLHLWTARSLKIVAENYPDVEATGWMEINRCRAYSPHAIALLFSDDFNSPGKDVASIFFNQRMIGAHAQDDVPCASCAANLMMKLSFIFDISQRVEDAMHWAIKAVSLRTFIYGEEHQCAIEALIRAATAYYDAGRLTEAREFGEKAVRLIDATDQPPSLVAWKFHMIGFICHEDGKPIEAEEYFLKALKIRTEIYGPDHFDVLTTKHILAADVYYIQSRFPESEKLLNELIESHTRISGPATPGTLQAKTVLSLLYMTTGRVDEALALSTEVSTLSASIFGPGDPQAITTLMHSAGSHYRLGRYSKAAELCQQGLELSTEVNGPEHPVTLEMMVLLGICYEKRKHHVEAEKLKAKYMECLIRTMGYHSSTIYAMTELASLYEGQERYKKAQPLREKVVEIEMEKLGSENPATILSVCELGLNYDCQGLHDKAAKYQYSALNYPLGHPEAKLPDYIRRMGFLAINLENNDNLVEAEKMARDAVGLARLHADPIPYLTVPSLISLASVCSSLNKVQEAETLYREALDVLSSRTEADKDLPDHMTSLASVLLQEARYKEADSMAAEAKGKLSKLPEPDEWTAVFNTRILAKAYAEQGRYREAEMLSCNILGQQLSRAWKPDDLTVSSLLGALNVLEELARTYGLLELYQQAEEIYDKTLSVRKQVKGSTNLHTLRVMALYTDILNSQGRYSEALKLGFDCKECYQQEVRRDIFPDQMIAASIDKGLALSYLGLRKYTDAEPLARGALEASSRNLGENHPQTLDFLAVLAKILREQNDKNLDVREMDQCVLDGWTKLVGEKHLKAIRAIEALAKTCERQGDEEEAQSLRERAKALRQSVDLGLDGDEKRKLDELVSRTFQRLDESTDLVVAALKTLAIE
jgi:tetratricopeptide (TPR) repeat protein